MSSGNSIDRTSYIENNLTSTNPSQVLGADQGPILQTLINLRGPVSIETFTSNGTWQNEGSGLFNWIYVRLVGGGGGSGGGAATVTGFGAESGSGGGGGYSEKLINVSGDTTVYAITVGLGGAGGLSGANPGQDGGTTSFGAVFSATGGLGGQGGVATSGSNSADGGAGGNGVGGDVNIPGSDGVNGRVLSGVPVTKNIAGASQLSGQRASRLTSLPGLQYGGGGTGIYNEGNSSDESGSDGADGIVIVWSFI